MGNAISAAAVPALCAAIGAIELVHFLDQHPGVAGTAAAAQAPALGSAVRAFFPLSAAWGFFIASVALAYRHLQRAGAADAANRRVPGPVAFMLCASAGLLEFFLFVVKIPGGGGADSSGSAEVARELGRAALLALPAVATATFFLGMLLIIVGHIRAGGEGGGGGAVAGNGPIEAPMGVLAKMAVGAAAGLVCLMAVAALFGA